MQFLLMKDGESIENQYTAFNWLYPSRINVARSTLLRFLRNYLASLVKCLSIIFNSFSSSYCKPLFIFLFTCLLNGIMLSKQAIMRAYNIHCTVTALQLYCLEFLWVVSSRNVLSWRLRDVQKILEKDTTLFCWPAEGLETGNVLNLKLRTVHE